MPYQSNADLPRPVSSALPADAQSIYREAFNNAWKTYADNTEREEVAHRVAWAAVKKRYRKGNWKWLPIRSKGET